jgi:hypothetical protein
MDPAALCLTFPFPGRAPTIDMVLAHKRKERVKVTRIDRLTRSIGDLQDIGAK